MDSLWRDANRRQIFERIVGMRRLGENAAVNEFVACQRYGETIRRQLGGFDGLHQL